MLWVERLSAWLEEGLKGLNYKVLRFLHNWVLCEGLEIRAGIFMEFRSVDMNKVL